MPARENNPVGTNNPVGAIPNRGFVWGLDVTNSRAANRTPAPMSGSESESEFDSDSDSDSDSEDLYTPTGRNCEPVKEKIVFTETNQAVLTKLGVTVEQLNELSESEKKQIKKILESNVLDDLAYLLECMEDMSSYALINWAEVFFIERDVKLSLIVSSTHIFLNQKAELAEKILSGIYLLLASANLGFSIASLAQVDLGNTLNSMFGTGWNYADGIGSVGIARQLYQDEIFLGVVNLVGNLQSVVCTIIANIAQFSNLIHLSNASVTGLLGFSSAAGMWVSLGMELYEIHQCDQRISKLEEKLKLVPADSDKKREIIQKALFIEQAQRENHIRNAKSWAACAIAMTAVAVISYVALSGMTFGALPAVTVLIAAMAFASAMMRHWWVGRVNHVENVKTCLQVPRPSEPIASSLFSRLNKAIQDNLLLKGSKFSDSVTIPNTSFFGKNAQITFAQYLKKLVIHQPERLRTILTSLETGDMEGLFVAVEGTVGTRILELLGFARIANQSLDVNFRSLNGGVVDRDLDGCRNANLDSLDLPPVPEL